MENFLLGIAIGQLVWFFTYGLNRIWLTFKSFIT